MKFYLILTIVFLVTLNAEAARISGLVTDDKGNILSYASILVKGSGRGTTANNEGRYFLQLEAGEYTIVCQYVGYQRQEKSVTIGNTDETINFRLSLQQTTMKEFVVKAGGEDPAYEIIRNAIRQRSYYLNQVEKFQCEVYVKGILKIRDYPNKLFGKTIDFEDGDTSKRRILFLSESIATYSVQKPDDSRIDVTSTKVSGQKDGFGFSQPQIVSFYENNIQVGSNLNPRGFISPIAESALNFYRYKLEGVFFEEGKEINRIRVTPRRKFEPLFSGVINITENDWRIHSLQLQLTKESQMDIIDTLRIDQLYVPLTNDVWVIKNQVIYPAVKMFGIDAHGSFVNVYSRFNLNPAFEERFFKNTVVKFYDSANKRTETYWDSIRPVPLQVEEVKDYKRKDSLEIARKNPAYLDSLDRRRNKFSMEGLFFTGLSFSKQKKRTTYSFAPVIQALSFNTVEGLVVNLEGTYTKRLDSILQSRKSFAVSPDIRYGFSNGHLNGGVSIVYNYGRKQAASFGIAGGKTVFQFNNDNPIRQRDNTLATLLLERNLMKIYEAWYGKINYSREITGGLNLWSLVQYQDRMPLENTSDYKLKDRAEKEYTPNYPVELITENIKRHQALIGTIGIRWQPGQRYIEFPDTKFSVGSKYPTLELSYIKGITGVAGSDVDYDKWRFIVSDGLQLNLAGRFSYRASVGGFLNRNKTQLPDYQHFNGNEFLFAARYLSSFQLAPYYLNSTTAPFYSTLHIEHHFGGLLTNKLPVIRRLNWHLVAGSNAFYVNQQNNYVEVFGGFENIFRIFRVDFIQSFSSGQRPDRGITVGMSGAFFGR